jgi:hypothetical protein
MILNYYYLRLLDQDGHVMYLPGCYRGKSPEDAARRLFDRYEKCMTVEILGEDDDDFEEPIRIEREGGN